jgi:hypothetical protein
MSVKLDENWTFKDIKNNIEALKNQYVGLLASFSYFEKKQRNIIIQKSKANIMNFRKIQIWQRERLWEVLNDDFSIEEFKKLQ